MPDAPRRFRWTALVRLAAAGLVLFLVARAVDGEEMWAALAAADWVLLLPAVVLSVVQLVSGGWLWQVLAKTVDSEVTLREATTAYVGSHAIAIWTPGRAGDFAARPQLMPRGSRRTWALAVGIEALLRHPVPLGLAAGAAWYAFPFRGSGWFVAAALVVAVISLALAVKPSLLDAVGHRFGISQRMGFFRGLSPGTITTLMVGHGVRYAMLGAQFGLLVWAMAPDENALWILSAGGLITLCLKLLLPLLSFAELGIREGGAVLVFGAIGVLPEAALNASLMLYGLNVLGPAVLGSAVWLRSPRSKQPGPPE